MALHESLEESLHIDRIIHVCIKNLSILKLVLTRAHNLQCLSNILKQGILPSLSELLVQVSIPNCRIKFDLFLDEFDPNHTAKLEKLALKNLKMSGEELEILSNKLTSLQLTELDMSGSFGFTGSLSILFNNSFLTLNTLILRSCLLNPDDMIALSRANVEDKLPQLKHLDISQNRKDEMSFLFTNSAQWNLLKTLTINDCNVLNADIEFLTLLEELRFPWPLLVQQSSPIARCWSGLKVIQCDHNILPDIADGVERGMLPALTTVRVICPFDKETCLIPSLFKLYKANIFVQNIS